MKYYLYTDNFDRVKKLAHAGHLVSLKLVWSWRQFNFVFRAEYVPIIEILKPVLDEIQLNWLRVQNHMAKAMQDSLGCNEIAK